MKDSKFKIFVTTYAILISGWLLSWLMIGDANWWLVLLNRIVPYLFIPMPIILLWGIYICEYKRLAILLVPLVIFVWLYHPYLLPKAARLGTGTSQFRVMTYNVLFSNSDYDAVANVILAYEPDLVALQEVSDSMMEGLKVRLEKTYPYSMMGTGNDYGTTAVFSKLPVTVSYVLDLRADRPAVIVKAEIGAETVTFVSLHLLAYNLWWTKLKDIPNVVMQRTAAQNLQAKILLDHLNADDGIVIAACDCNSYETASSYRILDGEMDNSAREVGWHFSGGYSDVKQDTALQHIDHVWFRGEVEPIQVYRVINMGGSDHHPVLAVFDFP